MAVQAEGAAAQRPGAGGASGLLVREASGAGSTAQGGLATREVTDSRWPGAFARTVASMQKRERSFSAEEGCDLPLKRSLCPWCREARRGRG